LVEEKLKDTNQIGYDM